MLLHGTVIILDFGRNFFRVIQCLFAVTFVVQHLFNRTFHNLSCLGKYAHHSTLGRFNQLRLVRLINSRLELREFLQVLLYAFFFIRLRGNREVPGIDMPVSLFRWRG